MFIWVSASAFGTNQERLFWSANEWERRKMMVRKVWVTQLTGFIWTFHCKQKSLFVISCRPFAFLCLNFCPGRLRRCDSCKGVAKSDTYKHSGFGFVRRLFCGPVDTFGLVFSCTRGPDSPIICFQQVYSVSLPGPHADQDLLHHC